MSIKTRMQALLGKEHRAGYTNDAIDALLGQALGTGGQPSATAAVATAVQAISAPFGTAILRGSPLPLTGAFMVDLVRRLMLSGNAVYEIDLDRGGILLRPASDFKVSGNSSRLSYELELATPSGEPITRRASAEAVIHVLVNTPPGTPWRGRAPWQCASISAEALGKIERSLLWDSSIPTGMLLPVPDGVSNPAKNGIRNALLNGKGGITPVETTSGGFGQGALAAPKGGDYDQKRFGAVLSEPNLKMRDSTSLAILHSYGVSEAMWGDGNAQLIGRRSLFLDVIEPLGRLVVEELSMKLDAACTLDFGPSQYRDHAHLSRAIKSYVDIGLSLEVIGTLVGLPLATPPPPGAARQAGQSIELTNGEGIDQQGTLLDTPQGTPTDLRVKHLRNGQVVGEHPGHESCELCQGRGAERGASNGHIEHATIS